MSYNLLLRPYYLARKNIWGLILLLFFGQKIAAQATLDIVEAYLKINIRQQDSSKIVLKETYTLNKSSDAQYKKKYLSQREEYDHKGRSELHLYYDFEGEMASKIIRFYPAERVEKGVFQQKGAAVDSVLYFYNPQGYRLAEYWTWGDNKTIDSVKYNYSPTGNLRAIAFNYLGKTKRDSLIYRGELLEKVWTFDAAERLQREMEFFYLDNALLKITHRNAKRIILEEEFFFYNGRGQVAKTLTKIYPETDTLSSPPMRQQTHAYRRNGSRKKTAIRNFDGQKKLTGTINITYDKHGTIVYQFIQSKAAEVYEKTWFVYTRRKK